MRAEVPGPVFGKLVSKLAHTAQILYLIYLAMTAVLTIILVIFQVPLLMPCFYRLVQQVQVDLGLTMPGLAFTPTQQPWNGLSG